jgi:AcrR family transcriptional regulator
MSKNQDTPTRLLDAAHVEFAEHGLAGARVDRIAERSGVNKQRVYAYFGSKEALFAAVLSRAFEHLTQEVPIPTTEAGLRGYAGEVFDYHRKNPTLVRLLGWEGLACHDQAITTEYDRRTYYLTRTAALATAFGLADPRVVARTLISIVATASWPFIVPQQTRLLLGKDDDTDDGWALLRASVAAAGEAIVDHMAATWRDAIAQPVG